jgi:acetyl-CoA synthetase
VLLTEKGEEIKERPAQGILALKGAWPSMMRDLYQNHERFEKTYFEPFKGYYFAGDGARIDADGYIWITGRVDDVINVSGHRIGTAEVENTLTDHSACSEAAVIGIDHEVKGQAIYAFVTLSDEAGKTGDREQIKKALIGHIRSQIGAFAVPEVIHWAPGLPKTRSGKIMRRILRKIADHKDDDLGDTSSLADPAVVEQIIKERPLKKSK